MLTGAASSVLLGDINQDGNLNVNDVVLAVNIVLGGAFSDYTIFLADVNQDGEVNVLDIIVLVNIILSN